MAIETQAVVVHQGRVIGPLPVDGDHVSINLGHRRDEGRWNGLDDRGRYSVLSAIGVRRYTLGEVIRANITSREILDYALRQEMRKRDTRIRRVLSYVRRHENDLLDDGLAGLRLREMALVLVDRLDRRVGRLALEALKGTDLTRSLWHFNHTLWILEAVKKAGVSGKPDERPVEFTLVRLLVERIALTELMNGVHIADIDWDEKWSS